MMAEVIKINRKLNVVLPAFMTDKGLVHVYSSPISLPAFREHYRMLGRTFTEVQRLGYGPITGPSLAGYVFRDEAKSFDDEAHSEMLLNEIKRLSFVVYPNETGWANMPFVEAVKRNILSEDQGDEAENFLVYFTCASWIKLPSEAIAMDSLRTLWKAQITSSTVMEFMNSLPTSTPEGNTGETVPTQLQEKQRLSVPA
jgi:hypothetical protein